MSNIKEGEAIVSAIKAAMDGRGVMSIEVTFERVRLYPEHPALYRMNTQEEAVLIPKLKIVFK